MIEIKAIENIEQKTNITLEIMNALPEWFSPPEDIRKKSIFHQKLPFWAVFDNNLPIGFITLKIHNLYTLEIYNLGILKKYHRQGLGRQLINVVSQYGVNNGFKFLTVKTLDSSAIYPPYDATRAFYSAENFFPLEVFLTYWNIENPCLFLIKLL